MSSSELTKDEVAVVDAMRRYGPYSKIEIERLNGKVVMITAVEKIKIDNKSQV